MLAGTAAGPRGRHCPARPGAAGQPPAPAGRPARRRRRARRCPRPGRGAGPECSVTQPSASSARSTIATASAPGHRHAGGDAHGRTRFDGRNQPQSPAICWPITGAACRHRPRAGRSHPRSRPGRGVESAAPAESSASTRPNAPDDGAWTAGGGATWVRIMARASWTDTMG